MKTPGGAVSIGIVGILGLALMLPAGVEAGKKKHGVPTLLTYKAMVHVAGGVTLTSQHDTFHACQPGQRWTLEEKTDVNIRGNMLIETYKKQQVRSTSVADPGSVNNDHELASYEESNYCLPDEPVELDKPDCNGFTVKGVAGLQPDARPNGPKRVSIGIGRKGEGIQDLSCIWGLPSKATPTGSQVGSLSSPWTSIVLPLDIRVGQLHTLGVKKSLIRTIRVGGTCARPVVYRGKKFPTDTTDMEDGDCVIDGDFAVTIKRLNRKSKQGVPVG